MANFYCPGCGRKESEISGDLCPSCYPRVKAPPVEIIPHGNQPRHTAVGLAPSFPRTQQVASYHSAGVGVVHSFAGQDAQILDHIEASSLLLTDLAQRMRGFAALDEETRKLIKATLSLAADFQNEVDRRKGR